MSLPIRWNPLRQMSRFDPLSDFEDVFRGLGMRSLPREYENALDMRMNVVEDDKNYRITVDMPGVKKDDINVSVESNQVTIDAEIKHEETRENEKELCSERYSGKGYRSFSLPIEVDSTKADARFDNGVLTLTLPKKASSVSKRLSVH